MRNALTPTGAFPCECLRHLSITSVDRRVLLGDASDFIPSRTSRACYRRVAKGDPGTPSERASCIAGLRRCVRRKGTGAEISSSASQIDAAPRSHARATSRSRTALSLGTKHAELPSSAEVVVIGGGVVGICIAYYLALKNCADVLVLEAASTFGGRTTQLCGGGIRVQFPSKTNIELSLLSSRLRNQFAGQMREQLDFHCTGYLLVAMSPDEARALRTAVDVQQNLGLDTQWLSPEGMAEVVPSMNFAGAIGASWNPTDGWTDPGEMVASYLTAAEALGVRFVPGMPVTGIHKAAGRVQRVTTRHGDVVARVVVNAAGPWAPVVSRMLGYALPILPLVHQVRITSPIRQFPPGMPTVMFAGEGVGFRHRGDNVVVGSTKARPHVGVRSPRVSSTFDAQIQALALKHLPSLGAARVVSRFAGIYEITNDAHAILGPVPNCAGFFCAAGFNGHGFMHAPASGYVMSQLIIDGSTDALDIRPLSAGRFATS